MNLLFVNKANFKMNQHQSHVKMYKLDFIKIPQGKVFKFNAQLEKCAMKYNK